MLTGDSLTAERLSSERDALIAEARTALGSAPSRVRVRHELRYRGQSFELGWRSPSPWARTPWNEAFARAHELRYGYRDDSSDVELVNIRVSVWGPPPTLRPLAPPRRAPAPASQADPLRRRCPWTPPSTAESSRPERNSAGRLSARFQRPRSWFRPAGRARWTRTGRSICTDTRARAPRGRDRARPDRAAGHHRRPARGVRGDGSGADPLRALLEHQGASRRLHGAVRPRRRDGHAGRAHPRAPRRDARRRRRGSARGALPRGLLDPQRPVRGRHPPARHHRHHANLRERPPPRLCRQPRAPRRRGRARARIDARRQPLAGGGGRGDLPPPPRRADDRGARGAHAPTGRAASRPARPARGQPHRSTTPVPARTNASARTGCARPPTRFSTTQSAALAPA